MSNNKLNTGTIKKFFVEFQEQELVWNKYVAEVDATDEEAAFEIVNKLIEDGLNPHLTLKCLQIGASEPIYSENKFLIEKDDSVVEIANSNLFIYIYMSIMDIARLGKDELYSYVEGKFNNNIEIHEMELFSIPSSNPLVNEVSMKCIIKEHTFNDIKFINNKPKKLFRPTVDAIKRLSLEIGSNDFWVKKEELFDSFELEQNDVFAVSHEMLFEYNVVDSHNLFLAK